jgi:hypothetical protein
MNAAWRISGAAMPAKMWVRRHPRTHASSTKSPSLVARHFRGLTRFLWARRLRLQTVGYKQDREPMSEHDGVCDNQCATARKLLILKTERCPSG